MEKLQNLKSLERAKAYMISTQIFMLLCLPTMLKVIQRPALFFVLAFWFISLMTVYFRIVRLNQRIQVLQK